MAAATITNQAAVVDAEVDVVADAEVDVEADVDAIIMPANKIAAVAAIVDLDFTPQFIIKMIYTTMEDVQVVAVAVVEVVAVTKVDMPDVAPTTHAQLVDAAHAHAIDLVDPADTAHADADE